MLPKIRPVSCCGKNPLGIALYKLTFSATVAKSTMSITAGCLKHQAKDSLYHRKGVQFLKKPIRNLSTPNRNFAKLWSKLLNTGLNCSVFSFNNKSVRDWFLGRLVWSWGLKSAAHIIGVVLKETNIEIKIAPDKTMANS